MWTINNYGEMVWVDDCEYTMTGTYGSPVTYEQSYATFPNWDDSGRWLGNFYEESCVVDKEIWDSWKEALGLKPKKKCLFEE